MNSTVPKIFEAAYQLLGRFTSNTAWRHFERIQKNQWLPIEELNALRWARMKVLLEYAEENIPFYRDLWKSAGASPRRFTCLKDMLNLPVVSKPDIIKAQEADAFGLSRRHDFEMTHTSGTTGPRMYLPFTQEDLQIKYASYLREFYATGWRLGARSAAMHYSGHPEFGGRYTGVPDRDNFVLIRQLAFRIAHRRVLLEPYALNHYQDIPLMGSWYQSLKQRRPFLLETMDFNFIALYRYIRDHDLPPLRIPKTIVLATLAPALKKRLEDFFSTEIFNRYGPHEIEGVAYACNQHRGLHMAIDCVHTEFLNDRHQPVDAGQSGHVVVTDMDSRVLPLIRYKIGDIGCQLEVPCTCGCNFPLMGDIQGRTQDAFADAAGAAVPAARVAAILQEDPDLDLFQADQDAAGRVEVRVVPPKGVNFLELERRVQSKLHALLGAGADIRVTGGGRLQLESNGKYCFARRVKSAGN